MGQRPVCPIGRQTDSHQSEFRTRRFLSPVAQIGIVAAISLYELVMIINRHYCLICCDTDFPSEIFFSSSATAAVGTGFV